jgi:hypothetical protein
MVTVFERGEGHCQVNRCGDVYGQSDGDSEPSRCSMNAGLLSPSPERLRAGASIAGCGHEMAPRPGMTVDHACADRHDAEPDPRHKSGPKVLPLGAVGRRVCARPGDNRRASLVPARDPLNAGAQRPPWDEHDKLRNFLRSRSATINTFPLPPARWHRDPHHAQISRVPSAAKRREM